MLARRIRDYMTHAPHTIGAEQTLETAHRLMRQHHVRHLPVLRARELIGVVSLGDLRLVESLDGSSPGEVTVEEAMSPDLFVVGPDTQVGTAVHAMVEHKLGCVPVVKDDEVVGIFTTIDAMRVLADFLDAERAARASTPTKTRGHARRIE